MITAIDTNIISALWLLEPGWEQAADRLSAQQKLAALVICPAVFAELHAHPGFGRAMADRFFEVSRITVIPMTPEMWALAGEKFAAYSLRRHSEGHSKPRRILADFVIGSHATLYADTLLTNDRRMYGTNFPQLKLV